MEEALFEFCSEEWVGAAHAFLVEAAEDADLEGVTFSCQETFTGAPSHLETDSQGRVGWYFRVKDGRVEAKSGFLSDPDVYVQGPYDAILPMARLITAEDPDGAAETTKTLEKMEANGSLVRKGEMGNMTWAAGLHDALARHTL